jgi:ATP-binding cassette subfamily B protein
MSRETVKRSNLFGYCGYGYDASHSLYFWGMRMAAAKGRIRVGAAVLPTVDVSADGLDTMLGRTFAAAPGISSEAGLSGGQWQRVALARSLMRAGRDLLVLDEAGSGMDAQAEAEVGAVLAEIRHGRTSLLISHRLSAIRDAHVIHVVEDGAVTRKGTHNELMAQETTYRRLFLTQAQGYRDEGATGGTPA